jgi:predicted flap endonuclease-1-like 5' DNA nuclease
MQEMATQSNKTECTVTCWGIAALVGLLAMVLLYVMADFGITQSIFTGGLVGCVLGLILVVFICRDQTATADLAAVRQSPTPAPEASTPPEAKPVDAAPAPVSDAIADAPAEQTVAADSSPAPVAIIQPSKPLPGEQELAERKGTWKYEAESKPEPATPEGKTAAKPSKASAAAEDARPEVLMSAPRPEGADDLKLISGVGPKLEETLNELGIYHFDQVAKFKKKDIGWVDARLRFKGRIERDDWMSQAKILAKGGETEFSKKKKKS